MNRQLKFASPYVCLNLLLLLKLLVFASLFLLKGFL